MWGKTSLYSIAIQLNVLGTHSLPPCKLLLSLEGPAAGICDWLQFWLFHGELVQMLTTVPQPATSGISVCIPNIAA